MSEDNGIIKEFFVSLGLKVDKGSEEKFKKTITEATFNASILADVVEGAAKVVISSVAKMSDEYDKLYWASKRLGSSVGDIKAAEYGLTQFGGSAQGVRSALEGINQFVRSNPGGKGFLQAIGVAPQDVDDAAASLKDLSAIFKKMPYYQAQRYAGMFGIDPQTLQAMLRDTGEFSRKYSDFAKSIGLDQDEAAAKANEFMTQFRMLKAEGELLMAGFGLDVLNRILPLLEKFSTWMTNVSENKEITTLAKDTRDLADSLGRLMDTLGRYASSPAAQAFGKGLMDAVDGALKRVSMLVTIIDDVLNGRWGEAYKHSKDLRNQTFKDMGNIIATPIAMVKASLDDADFTKGKVKVDNNVAGRAKQAYNYFVSQGWSHVHAAGIVAGMFAENSGLDPNKDNPTSGAHGIAQWLGKRKQALFDKYGPNATFEQQLQFMQSEFMDKGRNGEASAANQIRMKVSARDALDAYIRKYERPAEGAETFGDIKRGNHFLNSGILPSAPLVGNAGPNGVTLHQKTDIHIHGQHPDVAQRVADAQHNVNDFLARMFKGKVK